MNLYLSDYSYGNRMMIVARSEEVYDQLMQRGVDIMRITDDSIIFQPDNCIYPANKIKTNRLSLLCDYDIVEISDTGLLYRAYANNESDSTIFLGAKFNSNCIMCPAGDAERKKGFSYSQDLLMKYIDYLPYDLEYLVMTGGEPTLQTNLFLESLDRVKEKFPYTQVLLLTNGRSLSDKWLFEQVCQRHPNNFRIAIPVHGDNSELHDYITRAPGSFEQTILALRRLMNSDIKIEIRIVVTKANCDNLLGIARLISSKFPRVFCVNFIGLEPRGNCALNFDLLSRLRENGSVKNYAQICMQTLCRMRSASQGADVIHRLQVLHVHVFLVAPLCAGNMAQPGADQHERGFAVRKAPDHPRTPPDLPVQSLNHIVRADPCPVF